MSYEISLFDSKQLDIEGELAVRRNAGQRLAAVREVCRDGQPALTTDRHADNTDIPSLDDLAAASLEAERLALLVGCMICQSRRTPWGTERGG